MLREYGKELANVFLFFGVCCAAVGLLLAYTSCDDRCWWFLGGSAVLAMAAFFCAVAAE